MHLLLAQRPAIALVAELAHDVNIRGADAGVDARPAGLGQGFAASFDVGGHGARKGADGRAFDFLRDEPDGLEIFRRGRRIAGLDDVHVQLRQLPGDDEFLAAAEARAGGLLAISQRGIEYRYFLGHLIHSSARCCSLISAVQGSDLQRHVHARVRLSHALQSVYD